mmetsp:Transcript_18019/g.39975  ORF Transcript_18019/g.39975 Transcript_18019/m.39975 type:complete len:231 (+) Transcript_18019:1425-2117(+)
MPGCTSERRSDRGSERASLRTTCSDSCGGDAWYGGGCGEEAVERVDHEHGTAPPLRRAQQQLAGQVHQAAQALPAVGGAAAEPVPCCAHGLLQLLRRHQVHLALLRLGWLGHVHVRRLLCRLRLRLILLHLLWRSHFLHRRSSLTALATRRRLGRRSLRRQLGCLRLQHRPRSRLDRRNPRRLLFDGVLECGQRGPAKEGGEGVLEVYALALLRPARQHSTARVVGSQRA